MNAYIMPLFLFFGDVRVKWWFWKGIYSWDIKLMGVALKGVTAGFSEQSLIFSEAIAKIQPILTII